MAIFTHMGLPTYPDLKPIDLAMRPDLHPRLSLLPDGVSEYTFAGLYLFRATYDYRVGAVDENKILIHGIKNGTSFFMLPCGVPDDDALLLELFECYGYLKNLPESLVESRRERFERIGFTVTEDRDNFDYLYLRQDLAELAGKKFHKKRNHVNAFVNTYEYRESKLREPEIGDAMQVLEEWFAARDDKADYAATVEALERYDELGLRGYVVYVDQKPAAFAIGEPLMKGRSFVVHFEKAHEEYRGIYQFVNKAFAGTLPRHYTYINREQDLGDEGLRQAKMTYRPAGFVKKYRVVPADVA